MRRGRTEVLHDIDLDVHAGEFVAVVGANGAGKTTLIQAIAGVIPPPRGTVRIDGIDVGRSDARTLSSRVGFVFQNPEHQFIAHTVFDELAHGLRLRHLPDDEVRTRTEEVLERFGLADKAGMHPFLLSGGQKRRLSVGTALVAGAPVLALDEPTFGQDRARADELLRLLRELNHDGTTVLVVTHDMQLVTEYADRTIVLGGGRVLAEGPTADVFADAALIESAGLRLPPLRRGAAGADAASVPVSRLCASPTSPRAACAADRGRDAVTDTAPALGLQRPAATFDPYAQPAPASRLRFLYRLNPLAKLAAPVPAMVLLVFVRDAATPLAFLALAYALLLVGVRFTGRLALLLFVAVPVAVAVIGLGFSLWTDPSRVDQSPVIWQIGSWTLYAGALEVGFATALRLAAILALSLIAGLSTTGPDLVRAMVQQLRVPYRIGYTALAAFRFVPALRARARGDPPGASRARRPRRTRSVRGDRAVGGVRRAAARRGDPPRRARRPGDGRPRLRRLPGSHRAAPRAVARPRHRVHRPAVAASAALLSIFFPWGLS